MNRFGEVFSTRNMLQNIRDDSKIVFVPNLFFMGYFPQYIHNQRNVDLDKDPAGRFIHGDRLVDEIMSRSEMNPDVEKILDRICDENFIPPDTVQAYIDFSLNEFKKREEICDVKMSDFIEDNYKYKQLFYSPNHPFQFVLFELVRRILKFIGIRSESFYHLNDMLDENCFDYSMIGEEVPIYPAVRKFFDGTELLEKFYANRHFWNLYAGFRDFTREYIRLCWAEKFTR